MNREVGSRWDGYLRWNAALAEVVYNRDVAGLPAYLDLEDDLLDRAAERAGERGSGREGLIRAVRPTLRELEGRNGVFADHLTLLRRWRTASGEPPPVIALLGVLSLAAEDMRNGDGFASNNYYNRLMPLLGLAGVDSKRRVESAYRQCSHELWGGLNSWLEDLQGERGMPTAYAFSHEHIGRPLSQALLRNADREKLGELFTELGLRPRSRLLPSDMQPLLAEWLARYPSPASNTLRAMWKRSGARERITNIACEFLQNWEPIEATKGVGLPKGGPPRQESSLRLIALLRKFPVSVLELGVLGAGDIDQRAVVELLLTENNTERSVPLDVEPLAGGRWRLADPDQLETESQLAGYLKVRDSRGNLLRRQPRRLIPMVKDDLIHSYVEAERLPLGEGALIICRQDLATVTARALSLVARPGFRSWQDSPHGLPLGWRLFSDVQVLAALPTIDEVTGCTWPEDINVLQPLASSQVVIEGGLRLPGRVPRWSSLAAPELRVTTTDANQLEVTVRQMRALAEGIDNERYQLAGPVAILPFTELHLPDGDYEIQVTSAGPADSRPRPLDTVRLRLRSGQTPSPVPPQDPPLVYRTQRDAFGVLSASRHETTGQCWGEASTRNGELGGLRSEILPRVPPWWKNRLYGDGGRLSIARPRRLAATGALPDDCFHTGRHRMQLPTFYGKATGSTIEGYCKGCGLVKRFPARYSAVGRSPARAKINQPHFDLSVVPRVEHREIQPDIVLDALSHDGGGWAPGLEMVALQVEPSKLYADQFARSLESLGHLKISRDRQTLSFVEWEIESAGLAELVDGTFALVGRRDRRLLDALAKAATRAGGQLDRTDQAGVPSRVRLLGCSRQVVTMIAAQVGEAVGAPLEVHLDAATTEAEQLPPISAVAAALLEQPMPGYLRCERWDPDIARWLPAPDASTPGAYKLIGSGTSYCIRDRADVANARMRQGDPRLVKHIIALTSNKPLAGYDPETQSLYLPLGADLPSLYARAAVLCSGLQPVEHTAQRVVRYQAVPSSVAGRLATLLRS